MLEPVVKKLQCWKNWNEALLGEIIGKLDGDLDFNIGKQIAHFSYLVIYWEIHLVECLYSFFPKH